MANGQWPMATLIAHLNDLCIDIWVSVMIIWAPRWQRDMVQQCTNLVQFYIILIFLNICRVCRVPFQCRAVAAAHPIGLVVSHYLNKLKSFFGFTNIWHLRVWLQRDMIDMSTCHTIQLGSTNVFTNLETCEYCPGKQQSQWLFDKE